MIFKLKKTIGLVGYFGWGNFGDELFLEAHKQFLSPLYDLKVLHDQLQAPYFKKPINSYVDNVDAILIGGGDLLNPVRVSDLYWRKEYLKKPVFVYGIGVPNYKWSRANILKQYTDFLTHPNCKLIVVRDIESYNWIKQNIPVEDKLFWFPDAVCAWNRPNPPVVKAKEKVLGVVMRSHRSLTQDLQPLRKMIDHAKSLDYKIKHLVLANLELGTADLEMAKSIAQPDEEVFFSESLDEMCKEIASCSMLATIKFHGMVVASMYGIPCVAMSVTPKNRNFLKMIDRPEMLQSYGSEDLYKHLSYYPARIHNAVRYRLSQESKKGYELLIKSLNEYVG